MLHTPSMRLVLLMSVVLVAAPVFYAGELQASEPFIGQIQPFGFNFPPRGWALCQGQLLAISQYQALFSLLGTTYGGDGRTTFGLPDLRGRAPIGFGTGPGLSPRTIGQRFGSENASLISHTHSVAVPATIARGDEAQPGGNVLAYDPREDQYSTGTPNVSMRSFTSGSVGSGNGSQANMQPTLVINFSIALIGIYPSRY